MEYLVKFAPIETTDYMIFGFAVIFGVMIIYARSLKSRQKKNQQDYDMLLEIKKTIE